MPDRSRPRSTARPTAGFFSAPIHNACARRRFFLMCQPGGLEKFFDEIGNVPLSKKSPDTMKELMAKYGMEVLGPPIFASSWMQQH